MFKQIDKTNQFVEKIARDEVTRVPGLVHQKPQVAFMNATEIYEEH